MPDSGKSYTKFQSTLPRRERLLILTPPEDEQYFNPHSHEGSDGSSVMIVAFIANFNPHSHEGSDLVHRYCPALVVDFNPHSHEGSDLLCSFFLLSAVISIHTPTKGATFRKYCITRYPLRFQSTLPRRERRIKAYKPKPR